MKKFLFCVASSWLTFSFSQVDTPQQKNDSLKEVVISIGYGNKTKGTITGSVTQLKSEEILKNPVQSAVQAIQGKVAGLNIIATDEPGKQPVVLLRGMSTVLGNSSPLYIIDGVEATSLNGLSANDIESFNVLKDASSLAIYGNKAAYGVILVSTKKGKGKLKLTYDGNASIKEILNKVKMSDAYRFAYFNNVAIGDPTYFSLTNLPYNTNWLSEITQTGMALNNAVSLSGSSESATYYFGASHYTEQGILKGTDYKRTNLLSNNEFKLFDGKIKITQYANLSLIDNAPMPLNSFTNAYLQAPIVPVYYPNGHFGQPFLNESTGIVDYNGTRFNTVANPVAQLYYTNEKNKNQVLTASLQAEVKLLKSLTFTSRYGTTVDWGKGYVYTPNRNLWLANNPTADEEDYNTTDPINTLKQKRYNSYTWNWDNFLTFTKKIKKHDIVATLGTSRSTSRNEELLEATRRNVPEQSNYWYLDFSTYETNTNPFITVQNNHSTPLVAISYFARAEYTYAKKYMINASFRRDGMSDFQSSQRWGNFPGISFGWVISKEDFFKVEQINSLKFRAGYGEIGNANNINPNYTLFKGGYSYIYGTGQSISSGSSVVRVDDGVTWETTKELNIGLDLTAFRNRLTVNVDVYNKNTDDILLEVSYPPALSESPVQVNTGTVNNKGVETIVAWKDQINENLSYNIGANFSYNKNELTEVYNPFFSTMTGGGTNNGRYTKEVHVGDPLGAFYVYEVTGFDDNGNFTYSNNRVYAGSYIPTSTFGLSLGVQYRNFDLSTYWYGVAGNKVYNGLKAQRLQSVNVPYEVLNDFWTNTNTNATNPKPSQETPIPSTYYIEDGSFLRCNNITLGYQFPEFSEKINKVRIYATALNPFIFTKYSGFSPELPGESLATAGIELDAYPTNKTYILGISVNF